MALEDGSNGFCDRVIQTCTVLEVSRLRQTSQIPPTTSLKQSFSAHCKWHRHSIKTRVRCAVSGRCPAPIPEVSLDLPPVCGNHSTTCGSGLNLSLIFGASRPQHLPGHDHAPIGAQCCRHQPCPTLFQQLSDCSFMANTSNIKRTATSSREIAGSGRARGECGPPRTAAEPDHSLFELCAGGSRAAAQVSAQAYGRLSQVIQLTPAYFIRGPRGELF